VLTRDHTVLPATHTFIHKWNEPSCLCSPAAEHHRTLAGAHFPSDRGKEAKLAWVAGYTLRWYARLKTVTPITALRRIELTTTESQTTKLPSHLCLKFTLSFGSIWTLFVMAQLLRETASPRRHLNVGELVVWYWMPPIRTQSGTCPARRPSRPVASARPSVLSGSRHLRDRGSDCRWSRSSESLGRRTRTARTPSWREATRLDQDSATRWGRWRPVVPEPPTASCWRRVVFRQTARRPLRPFSISRIRATLPYSCIQFRYSSDLRLLSSNSKVMILLLILC